MAYSTITKPGLYFNTVKWSGDNTTPRNITGVGFQPDLIWGKCRNTAYNHKWYDSVRTFGDDKEISSSETTAQGGSNSNTYGYVSGTVSDGFTTTGSDNDYWNETGKTYVAWNWKANGAGSSNSDGTITTTTSANSTSGFSIIKYTGTGSGSATIGHGLSKKPRAMIVKLTSGSANWVWWQDTTGDGTSDIRVHLNGFDANYNNYPITFGTNTVTLPSTSNAKWSGSGSEYIAYCFADIPGFSKVGSYTGNGNANGTFIYTGFKPAFTMIKNTTGANRPSMDDIARSPFNEMNTALFADTSGTELTSSSYGMDYLSNGIKIYNSNANYNTSGHKYMYLCFAEEPLVANVGNGIPATAR